MREELLHLLENNGRLSTEDLAAMLGTSQEAVEKEMAELVVKQQYAESQKCTVFGCPNRQPPQLLYASSNHPEQ